MFIAKLPPLGLTTYFVKASSGLWLLINESFDCIKMFLVDEME